MSLGCESEMRREGGEGGNGSERIEPQTSRESSSPSSSRNAIRWKDSVMIVKKEEPREKRDEGEGN